MHQHTSRRPCRRRLLRCAQRTALPAIFGLILVGGAAANEPELVDLSLRELMELEVVSVSRKGENLSQSAAAIYVLTSDDIRRSGATCVPDALRLVPGVHVARLDANKWAISVRGSNGRFANKLLVLIDGRSVYASFFGGVFWDAQDILLEDIERIEVVRGPGASVWGANAVNGVINIITRSAAETQGGLVSVGAGDVDSYRVAARYGGSIGATTTYRAFAMAFDRGPFDAPRDQDAGDAWNMLRVGFRVDGSTANGSTWFVAGDLVDGDLGSRVLRYDPYPINYGVERTEQPYSGGFLQAEWRASDAGAGQLTLRGFCDLTDRNELILGEQRLTCESDIKLHRSLGSRHELIVGGGIRYSDAEFENSDTAYISRASDSQTIWSAFIQDEIRSEDGRRRLIVGSKFEHNDFTGFEFQPTLRFAWHPTRERTVWASVSRAVRTPAVAIALGTINSIPFLDPESGLIVTPRLVGTDDFESETVLTWELGYRAHGQNLLIDATAFYSNYDDLQLALRADPFLETNPPPAHIVVPYYGGNAGKARAYGAELAVDYRVSPGWRLAGSYSHVDFEVTDEPAFAARIVTGSSGSTAQDVAVLSSRFDLGSRTELDVTLRHASGLDDFGLDAYTTADIRLALRLRPGLELSVFGNDLIDDDRIEFVELLIGTPPALVSRRYFAALTWHERP